ncbi:hypothetical protein J2S19_003299 [Metabacillus malikii]|uniref:Pectate lyase n=1 Tax=Metabacillus malikii TaxID=1504265 RepID=A0ABT9ZIA8_9BACI|nr:hypothetical protein [Metabacillus malikii]
MKWKRFSNIFIVVLLLVGIIELTFQPYEAAAKNGEEGIIAFPGAEGGGMYASGGRGYDVYEVTTLEDYDKEDTPIKGSFRDAVSESNRTIVFRVSGTIQLRQPLKIKQKNLTIAGQTAPGDGIAVAGYGTDISGSENIIIRYMRFRPGSTNIEAEPDAFGGRDIKNAIIDHISTSWSVDETLSFYRNENTTLQWSIISESLYISGHVKGRHGYGGIWGGENATFANNLIASHTSRLPALGNTGNKLNPVSSTDMVNNVIYNWGFNSTYGGNDQENNVINNYYKPGPATHINVMNRLISPGQNGRSSWFYIEGNYMYGHQAISDDNTLGIEDIKEGTVFSKTPYDVLGHDTLTIKSAEQAYQEVLEKSGAILPRRDAVDARIVNDVKNGTGRFINNEWEVGGYPNLASIPAPKDSDHDGIPNEWELANGLNPIDKEDGKKITASGYSNLELYLNSLVDSNKRAENPGVILDSPKYNDIYKAGSKIKLKVKLNDKRNIAKVEYYRNDMKIGEVSNGNFDYEWKNPTDGTWYITAKAIDKDGNETQTTSMPIHVNTKNKLGDWKTKDIGNTPIKGNTSKTTEGLAVKGSGRIDKNADSFHFAYQKFDGDVELIARIDSITKVDNNAISGLMIRESLKQNAPTAMVSTSVVKADKQDTPYSVHFSTRKHSGEPIVAPGENDRPEDIGVPSIKGTTLPYWLKIARQGDIVSGYASVDGMTWTEVGQIELKMKGDIYVGFAVDGAKNSSKLSHYNTATFSNISLIVN